MNWEVIIGAAITGAFALAVARVTYKRSRKVDRAAERSGIASDTRADLALALDALQKDNAVLREEARYRDERIEFQLAARDARIAACEAICTELRHEVSRLYHKYGLADKLDIETPGTPGKGL